MGAAGSMVNEKTHYCGYQKKTITITDCEKCENEINCWNNVYGYEL